MNRKSQKSITFFGNLINFVKFNLIIRKLQNLIGLMLKLKAYFDEKNYYFYIKFSYLSK